MGKLRLWISPKVEENFINKQAQLGKKLVSISPFALIPYIPVRYYKFEKTENAYLFRSDTRSFETKEDEVEYLQLMADDGWEFFRGNFDHGDWGVNTYYFFRVNEQEEKQLYSDQTTKLINTYNTASYTFMTSVILTLLILLLPVDSFHISTSGSFLGFLNYLMPITLAAVIIVSAITRIFAQGKLKQLALTEGEI